MGDEISEVSRARECRALQASARTLFFTRSDMERHGSAEQSIDLPSSGCNAENRLLGAMQTHRGS